ncbi:hypothetical protein PLICRDRAFT_181037 [Plicaturopsis crispa FD-325 SS-3]|uniref:Uncharacterized protein n=1 Tax=Plicaturopsis crispa FD-325 SS-3 TaxID=944288 RepID=A0A0C9SV44_PLICR|nr:hypothetical protein PLICRDRAFT_181037 [Plicaturopsis crispa FD-325 SS-3]
MFVFSLVVVVYLPRLAARPQRRPTPRTFARGVFRMLDFFSSPPLDDDRARAHSRAARTPQLPGRSRSPHRHRHPHPTPSSPPRHGVSQRHPPPRPPPRSPAPLPPHHLQPHSPDFGIA